MERALLINAEYVFLYTVVDDNVDTNLVTKHIFKAQDLNIQSVLGENLYTKLMNDCPNFTGDYRTLVKHYIQPALAEWTTYHLMPFINFKLTNKAVSTKSSDNSQPSTVDDIRWLRDQVMNNAEFYSKRIKDYIMNNQDKFPEYFTTTNVHEIRPSRNIYFGGIYTSGYKKSNLPISRSDECCD